MKTNEERRMKLIWQEWLWNGAVASTIMIVAAGYIYLVVLLIHDGAGVLHAQALGEL